MKEFIEQQIISAVRELLSGRVNEILSDWEPVVPVIEFSDFSNAVTPVIVLATCEKTEKERLVRLESYTLTVTFTLPENPDGELFCYGYAYAVGKAVGEDVTLGVLRTVRLLPLKSIRRRKKLTAARGGKRLSPCG
jgi:hypothetical protein